MREEKLLRNRPIKTMKFYIKTNKITSAGSYIIFWNKSNLGLNISSKKNQIFFKTNRERGK